MAGPENWGTWNLKYSRREQCDGSAGRNLYRAATAADDIQQVGVGDAIMRGGEPAGTIRSGPGRAIHTATTTGGAPAVAAPGASPAPPSAAAASCSRRAAACCSARRRMA